MEENPAEAFRCYEQAAESGSAPALYQLGMCYTYADNGAFVPLNKVYITLRDDYKDAKFYINPYSIEVNVNNASKCYEINDDCLITKNSISFDYQLDNGAIDRAYSNIEFKF